MKMLVETTKEKINYIFWEKRMKGEKITNEVTVMMERLLLQNHNLRWLMVPQPFSRCVLFIL